MNVALDRLRKDRPGHELAVELFALWRRGELQLAVAASGYAFDLTDEKQLHDLFDAHGVPRTVQLAYPGVMFPGEGAIPGAAVEGFREAWEAVLADWNGPGKRPNNKDALHVETHVLEKRSAHQ